MIYNSFLCSHFGKIYFYFSFLVPNSGQGLLFSVLTLPTWEKVKWLTASVSQLGTNILFFSSHFPELGQGVFIFLDNFFFLHNIYSVLDFQNIARFFFKLFHSLMVFGIIFPHLFIGNIGYLCCIVICFFLLFKYCDSLP